MRQVLDNKSGVKIISIDTSTDMLERAKGYISQDQHTTPVEFQLDDISNTEISNASFVVLNFTLQFVAPEKRDALKREQGYSDLEIAQKRDSLENVMKIETQESHLARLKTAGFDVAQQWHQHSAFCSFFAVK